MRDGTGALRLATLLGGFLAGWDAAASFFVFPAVRDTLANGDGASASWVVSITGVVGASLLLQSGRLTDRFGAARMFVSGAAVFTIASVLSAVAPGLWWLVAARGLAGVGLTIMGPSAVALIIATAPADRVATAIARWGLFTAMAGVAGPIATAILIEATDWRAAYALQIPLGLVVLWLTRGTPMRSPAVTGGPRFSILASLLTVVGLASLILAITEADEWGWTNARTLGALALSIALICMLLLWSRDPLVAPIPIDLMRRRNFSLTLAMSVTAGIGFFGHWIAMLLYLREVWGYSLTRAGLMLTVMPASMSLLALAAGRLADRHGHRRVMIPGAALYALGFGAFAVGAGSEQNLALLIPALVGAGVGMATIWPSLTSVGTMGIAPARLGTGTALIHTLQRVGGAIGVTLPLALISAASSRGLVTQHLWAVWLLPAAGLVTALLALGLAPPSRAEPDL